MNQHDLLKLSPAFQLSNPETLQQAAAQCEVKLFARRSLIVEAGAPHRELLMLTKGKIELYRRNRESGAQILICILEAPALLGDVEHLADARKWVTSVRTITACTVVTIPTRAFEELVSSEPKVAAALYREMAGRQLLMLEVMQILALQKVENKILRLLDNETLDQQKKVSVDRLAMTIGVHPKTVRRHLASLRTQGLIEGAKREPRPTQKSNWRKLSDGFGGSWELPEYARS